MCVRVGEGYYPEGRLSIVMQCRGDFVKKPVLYLHNMAYNVHQPYMLLAGC